MSSDGSFNLPFPPPEGEPTLGRIPEALRDMPLLEKDVWHEVVAKAVETAPDHKQPVSILFVDLDNFKEVNDLYGHLVGDIVIDELQGSVGRVIRSTRHGKKPEPNSFPEPYRIPDVVTATQIQPGPPINSPATEDAEIAKLIDPEGSRIGGDEVAILAYTDEVGVLKIAERLRFVFNQYLDLPDNSYLKETGLDISIGVSTLSGNMTSSDLLGLADKAMYADKLSHLPALTEHQQQALRLVTKVLREAGIRLRDVPKYIKLGQGEDPKQD